jgi:hypothetical protein
MYLKIIKTIYHKLRDNMIFNGNNNLTWVTILTTSIQHSTGNPSETNYHKKQFLKGRGKIVSVDDIILCVETIKTPLEYCYNY